MKFELKTQFRIESARFLPNLPSSHPCSKTHGHSFVIILKLVGEQDPHIGWVRDYHEINSTALQVIGHLDHKLLNDVEGLRNPTSENLAVYIYNHLKPRLPELIQVSIQETPSTECSYPIESSYGRPQ